VGLGRFTSGWFAFRSEESLILTAVSERTVYVGCTDLFVGYLTVPYTQTYRNFRLDARMIMTRYCRLIWKELIMARCTRKALYHN
jgi:hypothetical protein